MASAYDRKVLNLLLEEVRAHRDAGELEQVDELLREALDVLELILRDL